MKRVLVTGAAGFIGSHLCDLVLERGTEIVAVDGFTDSYDQQEKRDRARRLSENSRFSLVEGDLANLELDQYLDGVEAVFHLAGRAGVRSSFSDFDKYQSDNVIATRRVIDSIKRHDPSIRLVAASSSSVYGNAPIPFVEDGEVDPVSPYGWSKLEAERMVLDASNDGLSTVALRYFTVYGPRQRPDMGFRKFIKAALSNETIEIYGDGNQSRDFTYVRDIVEATLAAAEAKESGLAINVGGGSIVTIRRVLELISHQLGRDIDVSFGPFAKGDVMHTGADLSLARRVLNYNPKYTIEEGIGLEFSYFKELYGDVFADNRAVEVLS
ncbi:MAG: NAD-dependent epimerase/dehydratase family protein [Actinomycetota bacterium]|nr:NAD-dependent epimerase/dehydratase family protein [Actinomycetota bacterium]